MVLPIQQEDSGSSYSTGGYWFFLFNRRIVVLPIQQEDSGSSLF